MNRCFRFTRTMMTEDGLSGKMNTGSGVIGSRVLTGTMMTDDGISGKVNTDSGVIGSRALTGSGART